MQFVSCRWLPGMFLHQLLNSVCAHTGIEYSTGYDTLWLASYICYHNSVSEAGAITTGTVHCHNSAVCDEHNKPASLEAESTDITTIDQNWNFDRT